ncbi:hypothetical protein SDC9_04326 [bioreactor metagenome]|uniref:Integrase catalytic domain-containing protein n=1 Tax=bioreactor metagenome TaxID=1076179 RepID=A0A644SVZ5_9ZZZZ
MIRVSECLVEASVEVSAGSVGDVNDNAMAETIDGLFNAEVIHHRGPLQGLNAVGYATFEWFYLFNYRRLLETIGNISPVKFEV